jgi:DNA end-binding protein Ku
LVVRPYWKGYLKLALVSCPIALHAACSTAERIKFRQVNKATGNRLRQQLIDEETGTPVGPEHKARGYEVAKGQYLIVADEDLDAIEIASTHTIEIDSFVPRSQIDQRFFDTPYYITPNEPVGQEAFAVIREAMRRKGMVALGRLVLSKRELTLAPDMLTLAGQIIDSKAADFDPSTFRDRYEEALLAHLKAKQAGAVQERKLNLMEALRRSVAEDKKPAAPRRAAPPAPARKRA